jgi:hypothetical protein
MRVPTAAQIEPRLRALVPWAAALTLLLWAPLVLHGAHSWDDADPECLYNAYRLTKGEPLFHSTDGPPWVHSPYTPLYQVLTGAALRVTGLSYYPARLITLLATLAVFAALRTLAVRWTGHARAGLWTACALALVPAFLYNCARPHPQMLGVALALWSYVLFDHAHPLVADLASPLLAVLAVYTKQTLIGWPIAAGLWLLWRHPRRFLRYAPVLTVVGVVPALLIQYATRGAFFDCILRLNLLPYSLAQIAPVLIHQAGILCAFFGLALVRWWHRVHTVPVEPLDIYLPVVVLLTLASLGRAGAHGQYVVEMLVVTMIFLLRTGGFRFPARREAWAVFQLAVLVSYAPLFVLFEEGLFARASIAAAPEVRALLATEPGPILSQQGSFPLFTRGEIHAQLFHFMSLSRVGLWDPTPLIHEVEQERIAWVVTESPLEQPMDDPDDRERFSPELRSALARHYVRRAVIGPYYVYRPR